MSSPPRILLVFAHPDDESFLAAGLVRRYVDCGAVTALITATRGDAGRLGTPPLCSREALPEFREHELREAAKILGITGLHLLNYRDKFLMDAPIASVRKELVKYIRFYRPHVVVTFGPDGLNGHPDHVAIARFTMDSIAAAADPRLVSNKMSPHRVQRVLWTAPIPPWEVTQSIDLRNEPGIDFVVDIVPYRNVKIDALRSHRTQHVPVDRCFFSKMDASPILDIELFRQAWGPVLQNVPLDDVLVGIDLSE